MADFDENEIDQVVDDLRFAGKAEGDIVCAAAADLIDQLRQRLAEAEAINLDAAAFVSEVASAANCLPSTFADGNGHIVEAVRKLALAEQDARRYRWLRDNAASAPGNTPCPYRWTNSDVPETVNGDLLDSEIDAAMRAAIDAAGHDSLPTGD